MKKGELLLNILKIPIYLVAFPIIIIGMVFVACGMDIWRVIFEGLWPWQKGIAEKETTE